MQWSCIVRYMVRCSFVFLLLGSFLFGADKGENLTQPQDNNKTQNDTMQPVIVEDRSGLTQKELRELAKKHDKAKKQNSLQIKDVVDSIEEDGKVNVTNLVKKEWDELMPTPRDGYDWIQTKYGDWLKGHIRSYYQREFEFDSQEFGIYTFELSDLKQILSYGVMNINIDNVAIFQGIIRYKDKKITIITGDAIYTFDKNMIISISNAKEKERYKWAGNFSLSVDIRKGNNDQSDFALQGHLQRRTPKNRFSLDYLGRYSSKDEDKTAEDNRINARYDIYYTRKFFYTPLFGEYYQNYFQNIRYQITAGFGIGYTFYDTIKTEWDIAVGPAYLTIKNYNVVDDDSVSHSLSFEFASKFKYSFNKLNKIRFDYKFSLTDKESGTYKHHSVLKFENDLIKDRIFIDTSLIWDYIHHVEEKENGYTPTKSDFQILVGGGLIF